MDGIQGMHSEVDGESTFISMHQHAFSKHGPYRVRSQNNGEAACSRRKPVLLLRHQANKVGHRKMDVPRDCHVHCPGADVQPILITKDAVQANIKVSAGMKASNATQRWRNFQHVKKRTIRFSKGLTVWSANISMLACVLSVSVLMHTAGASERQIQKDRQAVDTSSKQARRFESGGVGMSMDNSYVDPTWWLDMAMRMQVFTPCSNLCASEYMRVCMCACVFEHGSPHSCM